MNAQNSTHPGKLFARSTAETSMAPSSGWLSMLTMVSSGYHNETVTKKVTVGTLQAHDHLNRCAGRRVSDT